MDLLCSVNWIALLVLAITLLLFKVLNQLAMKINWTFVVLISMVMGAVIGLVFASDNNSYLVWVDLIGDIYINVITALVAPVILISIMSGFISLNSKEKMKSIGLTSVLWLLASSAAAIVLSYIFGAEAVFADIASVSDSTISSYEELATSFDKVILKFFPTNVIGDLANDNVVAIIIIAIAVAVAYVGISTEEGEEKVVAFKNLVEALKNIIYRILAFVIDLTPFAVLDLMQSLLSVLQNSARLNSSRRFFRHRSQHLRLQVVLDQSLPLLSVRERVLVSMRKSRTLQHPLVQPSVCRDVHVYGRFFWLFSIPMRWVLRGQYLTM